MLGILERYRCTEDAHAAHNFSYYFWTLVVHSGARISYPAAHLAPGIPPALLATLATSGVSVDDAAGSDGAGDGLRDAAVNAPGIETWLSHDWDVQSTGMSTYPTSATRSVRLTGTLLQRAHWCNPEHVLDVGLVDARGERVVVDAGGAPATAAAAAGGPSARLRAWVALIGQRTMVDLAATGRARVQYLDGFTLQALPEAGGGGPVEFLVFPPPCASPKPEHVRFASAALRAACAPHVRMFVHPPEAGARSWMDLQHAAWVLAAMDVALRTGGVVGGDALERNAEACTELGLRATDALRSLFLRARFVGVNVCVGSGSGGIGVLDYLMRDREGRWHAIVCRACGDPASTGAVDMVKARVLAGAALHCARIAAPIASVRVLYVPSGVEVVEELGAPLLQRLYAVVAVEGALPPWALDSHVGYAHTRDGVTADVLLDGVCTVGVPLSDVLAAMVAGPRRWVTWGWRAVMDAATAAGDGRPAALMHAVRDLEVVIAMRVGAASAHAQTALLDMDNARVTLPTPTPVEAEGAPPRSSAAHGLRHLYMGIVTKGLLVYFWDSRPHGLDIRTLPTLATLHAVLGA
jgi:hypothetical protein